MGLLETIAQMKNQGMGDSDIAEYLRKQGITPRDISDALSQSEIKSAVEGEYEARENPEEEYTPSPQYENQPQEVQENYYPQEQTYQEYSPQGYENYGAAPAYSQTDSMMDVAGQVFEEKTKKMQKQVETFEQFKNLAMIQLQNISDRLKRMESTFDALQVAVVERVGSYGKDISSLKKEVTMVEDSFSKLAREKTEAHHENLAEKKRK